MKIRCAIRQLRLPELKGFHLILNKTWTLGSLVSTNRDRCRKHNLNKQIYTRILIMRWENEVDRLRTEHNAASFLLIFEQKLNCEQQRKQWSIPTIPTHDLRWMKKEVTSLVSRMNFIHFLLDETSGWLSALSQASHSNQAEKEAILSYLSNPVIDFNLPPTHNKLNAKWKMDEALIVNFFK